MAVLPLMRRAVPSKALTCPYLLEKGDPLLDGVVLGGVVWGGVQPVKLDMAPLISAGRYSLLARMKGIQTTAYVMNIDLGQSNLSESPDWPILLSNLVELRRDNLPGLRRWNYRLNEDIRFRLFEGQESEEQVSFERESNPTGLAFDPLARFGDSENAGNRIQMTPFLGCHESRQARGG